MRFLKFLLLLSIMSGAALAGENVSHKPLVAVSINPLYQILLAITKDKNNSRLMIDSTISEHDYQLKKSDVEFFAKADLVFYIDDELEKSFAKLIRNSAAQKKSYKVSAINKIKLLQQGNNVKKLDVHLWLDPQNAIKIAEFMTQKICEIDQENCHNYQKNFAEFKNKILKTEKNIAAKLLQIKAPESVFYHDGFQYFENYFHIKPSKVITHDERELNSKDLRELDSLAKSGQVKCIFGDAHDEKNSAARLAKNYNLKFLLIDLVGKGEGYEALLTNVADALLDCEK